MELPIVTRIKRELAELQHELSHDLPKRLEEARAHGDLRENAEYDAAKNEQGLMEARIRTLRELLRDPDIVEAPAAADAVGPGMLVTLRPLDEDEPEDELYLLATSKEERAPGARERARYVRTTIGTPNR